eukprot:GAHX01002613.1.p1 GENE.GAHX01002613.1~~GAHX01002613.1.p1  ORF type:complete len:169 (-),score=48.36 GAHX01002613.1:94-600(-)
MNKDELRAYLKDSMYNNNGNLIFEYKETLKDNIDGFVNILIEKKLLENNEDIPDVKKLKGDDKTPITINEAEVKKKLKILRFHLDNKISKMRSSYKLPTSEKYKKENIAILTTKWKETAQDVIEEIVKVYKNNDNTRERGSLILEILKTFNIDKEWLSYDEEEEDFIN